MAISNYFGLLKVLPPKILCLKLQDILRQLPLLVERLITFRSDSCRTELLKGINLLRRIHLQHNVKTLKPKERKKRSLIFIKALIDTKVVKAFNENPKSAYSYFLLLITVLQESCYKVRPNKA